MDQIWLQLQYLQTSSQVVVMVSHLYLQRGSLSKQLHVVLLEVQGHLETLSGFLEVLLLFHDSSVGVPAEHA